MNMKLQQGRSDLFLVRMWTEQLDQEQAEWRGKIQHITSGEVHYFRDWRTLIALLTGEKPDSADGLPGEEAGFPIAGQDGSAGQGPTGSEQINIPTGFE